MLKQLKSFVGLLIVLISVAACRPPEIQNIERCIVSTDYNICRCHDYQITPERISRTSESRDYPIEYCNNMVGFRPNHWVAIRLFLDDLYYYASRRKKH